MNVTIDWAAIERDALEPLKPFQRSTVEWAFQCLFPPDDQPCSGRFLVADEAGLGKTLVARGVLAKTLRHLQGKNGRLDVVYICSNADIAKQNIRRLSIAGLHELSFRSEDRLTLMPLIPLRRDSRPAPDSALPTSGVNLLALTPGTSLDFHNGSGHAKERALLALMVTEVLPDFERVRCELFMQKVGRKRFQDRIDRLSASHRIDPILQMRFSEQLRRHRDDGRTLETRLIELSQRFLCQRAEGYRDPDQREAAILIADLRRVLAGVCIQALEPDLLILDEFQRFPHLLDGNDPGAELARQLYERETDGRKARVLMLSATPYRMSSVGEGPDDVSHHEEFIAMVRFLLRDDESSLRHLRELIERLNDGLRTVDPENTAPLEALRDQIQALLRGVMSRTDRTPASGERDAMVHALRLPVYPDGSQILTYVGLQRVAGYLEVPDLLEYWRSAPAPLSFLSGYKLRDRLIAALDSPHETLCAALITPGLFLGDEGAPGSENGHARTAALARSMIDAGLHRVAWLPPSRPGYVLGGPFAKLCAAARTKRLLFSRWRMVPRAVSTVLEGLLTAAQQREFGRPAARRHEEADGDYQLGYPSAVLADLGHPDRWAAACEAEGVTPTVDVLIKRLMPMMTSLIDEIDARYGGELHGAEDHAWYWMGPALADAIALERQRSRGEADNFLPFDLQALEGEPDGEPLWSHEAMAARRARWDAVRRGDSPLGKRPADLVAVMSHLALASPAVCALRALADDPSQHWEEHHRQTASGVAAALLHYLGNQETVQVLAGLYPEERSFSMRVLRHASDGGLQALLDEYLAVLDVDQPLATEHACGTLSALAARLAQMEMVLRLRPAVLKPELLRRDEDGRFCLVPQARRLRLARPLLEDSGDGDEHDGRVAMTQLRAAFNSPFLPFVLSSTSIGQEGLDFHWYCHAIVHWNLPASPVDFEQRDGRIHRFRNHAVRRNLARDWGGAALYEAPGRVGWDWMFDRATAAIQEAGTDARGMRPSWVYREGESAPPRSTPSWMLASMGAPASIERHVPVIPHSRDDARLRRITQAVGTYRMLFAQPRQEDLLAHLLQIGASALNDLSERIVIDLRPSVLPSSLD